MDWKQSALDYLVRIDETTSNIKNILKNCSNADITKATRQDSHDLEAAVLGLVYALNKIQMLNFPDQQKKPISCVD